MASTERFGYEWDTYREMLPQYEEQFLKWVHPLDKDYFTGKTILDAGCGMGRNSYWCLKYGAARVVAFDFDERTVAAARENLSAFPNAEVRRGDIYLFTHLSQFDLVFSIGVIHHLEDPRRAVRHLASLLKPGGKLLIWVYGYEGNEWIVRYINPVRKALTSRLPVGLVHALSYFASLPLYAFLRIVPQGKPYLAQLKTFSFKHIHSIVFDQLLPRVANYWTRDQARALFESVPALSDVAVYRVNDNSWTVIGKRKSA